MATDGKNLSRFDKDRFPNAPKLNIGLAVAEWNASITGALYQGASETLKACGVPAENIHKVEVPGAFELVYACKKMQKKTYSKQGKRLLYKLDAIIAIGCVIRGETAHFDYVCQAVTHGIKSLNLNGSCPVIFCVLTDDTEQQSKDRSGGKHGNKGVEAAVAALQMAHLFS
ncbi:MAG: 6,7-dimethyl-8-ribityllumazine synthase [Flavobacteriaceae bacterium]|nr:6,7-dimethyl-8-ribityllumazine synthase [Flavobacteriaceae bacterium]